MKRHIPGPLWITIVVLGLIVILHLGLGFKTSSVPLLVSAALEVVLIAGLVLHQKWAYIIILVFACLGAGVGLARDAMQGLAVLAANAVVVAPMVLCTSFFFPKRENRPEANGNEDAGAV